MTITAIVCNIRPSSRLAGWALYYAATQEYGGNFYLFSTEYLHNFEAAVPVADF